MRALPLLLLSLTSCAHSYFYTPEVTGPGAGVRQGAIAFKLPATDPSLKMKIVVVGVTDTPAEAKSSKKLKMVQVRYYIVRAKAAPSPQDFIDAGEQKLILTEGVEIPPSLLHASVEHPGKVIHLSSSPKQIVELFFPLPVGIRGPGEMQSLKLKWKVHFTTANAESQTTRFDRQDKAPQQGAEMYPFDNDFPLDVSPQITPGWDVDPWPWAWWEPFPMMY